MQGSAAQLESMAGTLFHGIFIPEGVDKRILYQSEFRIIVTYAMTLEELDRELAHILKAKKATIKDDDRANLRGKRTPGLAPRRPLSAAPAYRVPAVCCLQLTSSQLATS